MRDIALAMFIAGTLPMIFTQPYIGLLVWSWLGYMNPHRLCYGFAYNFPWVQLIAIVTLVSFVFSKERKRIPISSTTVLLILFFVWTTVATFAAQDSSLGWPTWEEFGKTLVMVFMTFLLVTDRKRIHWLVWVIVISLGFYGIRGGLFTILKGGAYHVLGPPHSFISNNNDLAAALCMTLPLMRYLQLQATRRVIRVGLGFSMLLTGIAILGTYSRGGLIALTVVGTVLLWKSRRRLAVAVVLVVVALTAYHFMPARWTARMDTLHHAESTLSAQERIRSWKFAANVALHHPVVGGGLNVYQNSAMWKEYAPEGAIERAVHSVYFRVLGEQGFPGLLLFLSLLFIGWRNCARVRRRTRNAENEKWAFDLASMLQASLLAYMIAESAGTLAYFGLSYQLIAICALLNGMMVPRSAEADSVSVSQKRRVPAVQRQGHIPISARDG